MNYKNMYLNAVAPLTKSSLMRNKQHLPPLHLSRPRGAPKKLDIGKALKYKSEAQKLVVTVFERAIQREHVEILYQYSRKIIRIKNGNNRESE